MYEGECACKENTSGKSDIPLFLYHAIGNTANPNAGKPLYIRWYSTEPSPHALY